MHDLVGAYQRIDELYRLYIKSAFPLRSEILNRERDELVARQTVLSQPPLLEPIPIYPSEGINLSQAEARLSSDYAGISKICQRLFPPGRHLYQHQWESIQQVLENGKDLIVTTGTGSGKTECFLLPLLAQLVKESLSWPNISTTPQGHEWWRQDNPTKRTSQWEHSERPPAMRALILYPLNALVEDQLMRLRMVLDDDDTHQWLDANRGGNRITFGRYTSQTPIPGIEGLQRIRRLGRELRRSDGT